MAKRADPQYELVRKATYSNRIHSTHGMWLKSDREVQLQAGDQGRCLKNHSNCITVTRGSEGVHIDARRGAATTQWLDAHMYCRPGPTNCRASNVV